MIWESEILHHHTCDIFVLLLEDDQAYLITDHLETLKVRKSIKEDNNMRKGYMNEVAEWVVLFGNGEKAYIDPITRHLFTSLESIFDFHGITRAMVKYRMVRKGMSFNDAVEDAVNASSRRTPATPITVNGVAYESKKAASRHFAANNGNFWKHLNEGMSAEEAMLNAYSFKVKIVGPDGVEFTGAAELAKHIGVSTDVAGISSACPASIFDVQSLARLALASFPSQ